MLVHHDGYSNAKKFFNSKTASSYDSIVKITTFGKDAQWKSQVLARIRNKKRVLDIASGTGILSELIRKEEDRVMVAGLDLTYDYLQVAHRKGINNCVQATAEATPYKNETFDAVVSSYLAKYVDAEVLADECWRLLQHGGVAVFHDFMCPKNPAMRALWHFYFLVLRTGGSMVASKWMDVFCDLDGVICRSQWLDLLTTALNNCGFKNIRSTSFTLGTAAMVVAEKP